MTARDTDWDGVRLHVVTGKGGTGKTTVAAALALALAHAGRKVLLIEAEGRQGIARLFDRPPLPYEERKIAIGPGEADDGRDPGGDVYALAIDPEGALLDYLQMFYGMRSAGVALTRLGMVDFATTIAPGLADVLVTGKATEATRRRQAGSASGFAYDAVVLDAPPTGRIGRFLNVSAEVSGLAKVGPVRSHADTRGQCDQVTADRRALRLHARGDARPGDPRRDRRDPRDPRHAGRRHRDQHGPPRGAEPARS